MLWIAKILKENGFFISIIELLHTNEVSRVDVLLQEAAAVGVAFSRAPRTGGYCEAIARVLRIAKESRGCIVWTWGTRADLAWWLCQRLLGARIWVCSLRNANASGLHRLRLLYRILDRTVTCYIANTSENVVMLNRLVPGVDKRAFVVRNAVMELGSRSVRLSNTRPAIMRVAMLGNIDVYRKGYDTAIRVGHLIAARKLPVEIHIAGRPDAGQWLKMEIGKGLAHVIHYHGETCDPITHLAGCHAFLLLSRHEGMPNALLEALSLGLPCIVTRVGDLPKMVTKPEPFALVEIDAAEEVLICIEAFVRKWDEALAMGVRGRRWCEDHFSPERCATELLNTMRLLCAGQTVASEKAVTI